MIEQENKSGRLVKILVGIITILILGLLIMLVIKPQIENYILNKQIEAYNIGRTETINAILTEIQEKGGATIKIGEQTITLVPYTQEGFQ